MMIKHVERGNSKEHSDCTFLTHFTKTFFATLKGKSGTDMISTSIESYDFLFWHEKNFELKFCKFRGKQTN